MTDRTHPASDVNAADAGGEASPWPDCHWNLKDPRSCQEPDSCGCYVDPCVYFGVAPEDCCIDADILCGG